MLLKRARTREKVDERKRGDENLLLSIFPIKLVLRKIFPRVRFPSNRAVKLSSICHCELCKMRCEKVFCVATKSLLSIRFFTAPETFTPERVSPSTNLNCESPVTHNNDTSATPQHLHLSPASHDGDGRLGLKGGYLHVKP